MRDAENAAFVHGVSAEALMNQAGAGIAQTVQQFFPRPGYCLVFSGKGNNGGDALVAAAQLKRAGWHTDVHLSFPESQSSDLLRRKITEFRDTPPVAAAVVAAVSAANPSRAHTVILDGLLGLGSKPPLRDPSWRRAVRLIGCARNAGHTFSRLISPPGWTVIPGQPIAIASLLISPSRLRRRSAASLL